MTEERRRILRMLAERQITAQECRELLDALGASHVEASSVPAPVPASRARRRNGSSAWAVVLCILLLLLCPPLILLLPLAALLFLPALAVGIVVCLLRSLKWLLYIFLGVLLLGLAALGLFPLVLIALPVIATVYWLCMLIGCLARDVNDFGVLVTSDPALDKFLWILLVLFTWVLGAVAYDLAVRHRPRAPARQRA